MANNLPGVYTLYKERKPMVVSTPENNTEHILFLGTATDGPVLTPVNVTRPADAINIFGTYAVPRIGSPMLVPAATEAYYAGARNMTLIRITGKDATATLSDTQGVVADLYGKYPGAKYNNVKFVVSATELKVWNVSDSLLGNVEPSFVYDFATYDTLNKLALAVNKDTPNSDFRMVVRDGKLDVKCNTLTEVTDGTLAGGDDELDPEIGTYSLQAGLRGALAKAYDLFYEYDADLVVPLGVNVGFTDDVTPTYDKQDAMELAKFCFEAANRNNDIIGVIGVKPAKDLTLAGIKTYAEQLASCDNTYVNDQGVDIGKYINIVVGEPQYNDSLIGGYFNIAAASYFGLASKLPVQSGTTNKVIPNAVQLRYNLSPTQAEALSKNKFTVLRYKPGRGVVVIEGLLASLPGSDFTALSTVRIIHSMINAVRQATDTFIGEPLDIPHVNSIDTAIRNVIATFAKNGAITSGTFQLYFGNNNTIIGDIDVELELEIPSELRRILVTVSRRFPNLSTSNQ